MTTGTPPRLVDLFCRLFRFRRPSQTEAARETYFLFWSVLGMTAGLVGGFCVLLGLLAVGEPFFEDHRHPIAAALAGAGLLALAVAWFQARKRRRAPATNPETPPGDSSQAPPFDSTL